MNLKNKMKKNFNWKKHFEEYLNSTQFLSLATYGEKGVWVCPVYFVFDEKFNLYFISQPTSRHMRNIKSNSKVSVAIYSTNQSPLKDVFGVQLEGEANILSEPDEIEKARSTYFKETEFRQPVKEGDYLTENSWLFVRIIPKEVYCFDTRYFGEERQKIPMEIFK